MNISFQDPFWLSIAMALGMTVLSTILVIAFISVQEYVEKWQKRGTVLETVKLTKSGDDYGFTMKNGKVTEVRLNWLERNKNIHLSWKPNLFQVTSDSQDGVVKGDVIVRVNGVWVADLDDWRINQLFKTMDNEMTLKVRRKEDHLTYLDKLPYIDE